MNVYLIVSLILAIYLVLAWFAGTLLQLHGAGLWILRGSLAVIGFIGAGAFLWYRHRLKRNMAGAGKPGAMTEQITLLLRQAEQKLMDSKKGTIRSLPVIFVLGEANSAKTSTILHSGIEPELLAGHVFHDSNVIPTASINVWYARKTIFIEAGGNLAGEPQAWLHLLRRTSPPRFSAAVRKGEQAPRAALVCLNCERLTAEQNSAQKLSSRLKEMARSLGAPFPVYVLFTKLDRIAHFTEYVGNLTSQESVQILGATLARATTTGVFAEEQSKRLVAAFDQIMFSLAEKRLEYLAREATAEKLGSVYEFPREFGKFKNQIAQFLVELSRPTQLSSNPFLRGFYFSGVRPVIINEAMAMAAGAKTAAVADSRATRMFEFASGAPLPPQSAAVRSIQSRKVPEWTFLPHLFTEIILRDGTALSSSHRSVRIDRVRRVMLACVLLMCVFYTTALVISYFKNRALENEIQQAAERLAQVSSIPVDVPDTEQLRNLEQLHSSLDTLLKYRTEGPPLSYRFGLYAGDRVYPEARKLYIQNFRHLLLESTLGRITARLTELPLQSSAGDDYGEIYDSLKAYLITTSCRDKSTRNFLQPVLLDRWSNGRVTDPERIELARTQFGFFSEQLPHEQDYASPEDKAAIDHARLYLNNATQFDRLYQTLLSTIGKNNPSIKFSRLYPGAASVVINNHEVPGAFTKAGYTAMQAALAHPDKFFGGEDWVLGNNKKDTVLSEKLKEGLTNRYTSDFSAQWRSFLAATVIVRYSSLPDAANKLQPLSGPVSPLLQLFSLVAQNIPAESPVISAQFQPVVAVAGNPQQLIGGANQPYMQALLGLRTSIEGLVSQYPRVPADPMVTAPVVQAAIAAKGAVGQIAQSFHPDHEAHIEAQVQKLMEAPITSVEALVRSTLPAALNAAGAGIYSQCVEITKKYPFNPKASEEATLQDLKFFQPGSGALWSFYDANLKNVLMPQGTQFVRNPASSVDVKPEFRTFLATASAISNILFPAGAQTPHFSYTLRQLPVKGINRLALTVDGKTLSGEAQSQQFEWLGEGNTGARVTGDPGGGIQFEYLSSQGPWAAFHIFQQGTLHQENGREVLKVPLLAGNNPVRANGIPVTIDYEVQSVAAQLFGQRIFSRLSCASVGAH